MSDSEQPSTANAAVNQPNITTPQMFTSKVPIPPNINLKGDLKQNWKQWKQIWDAYEFVTNLNQQSNEYRVATFITCIGHEALKIHNGLPFKTEDEKKDITKILELWNEHCSGKTNIIYERYKFNNRAQNSDESIDAYATVLRDSASSCNFGVLKEEMIRDRLVCGIIDNSIRRKLLQISDLTYDKCIDVCRATEATKSQLSAMAANDTLPASDVNFTANSKKKPSKNDATKTGGDHDFECRYCGRRHIRGRNNCPAFGKTCAKCGKANHFAAKCLSSKRKPVNTVEVESDDSDILTISITEDKQSVMHISQGKESGKIFATMQIDHHPVRMLVDSGASCNVIPAKYIPKSTLIRRTKNKLVMYSKSTMPVIGTARLKLVNSKNATTHWADFTIVDGDYTPLLGSTTAQQMDLLTVQYENILNTVTHNKPEQKEVNNCRGDLESVMESYADVFDESLGSMEGKVHLEINPNARPVIMPPRRVPVAIKDKVKKELERLTERGAITPIQEPTDWVSSLITTTKADGNIRLCIDPHHLNPELKRSHYPLPIIEEILPELAKAKVFSKADLREGFLQVSLDDTSSRLTTFQTPWGRYRWLRMPFGISPAPELFQMKLDQNLEGLKGVFKIADDILITGQGDTESEAEEDHDRNLANFLDRCRERQIKLNKAKFNFKCQEVSFIGHQLTKDGLKLDPRKVDAILKMEKPKDVAGVQRLIGLVKYLAKFLESLSQVCEPIRRLTHKETQWNWTHEQDEAFERIKAAVTTAPVLQYFDSSKPTEGCGDASSQGLGFVLTQEDHPISYASRALTTAEQRYSQIEKELLAQVFGLEHNHYYTYGRRITLWTDHKPLVSIAKKPLASAPKRLQRLLLRLQQYDAEIQYRPGKEMYLADTLSRAFLRNNQRSEAEEEVESIHVVDYLAISKQQLEEIQKETLKDPTLQVVKKTILEGWPDSNSTVPMQARQYYSIRDELTVHDDILFKGQRCIIPQNLRQKIKERLHSSHVGVQGCLRRAREVVYWPGMNKDVTEYIQKCDVCNTFSAEQQKQPLITHDVPDRPWQRIACDIFMLDGKDYLCTVDFYSGYFEVDRLEKKTGKALIKKLKRHFSNQGIPNKLFSDNGPPFNSLEFKEFAEQYDFELKTSSPNYPQSNGRVENAVKTAKHLLKKSISAGQDFYLTLLDWRNTPSEGMDSSPAQRLLGRRTRTLLPTTAQLLKPETQPNVPAKLLKRKELQRKYYNRSTKDLSPLQKGDTVRVHPLSTDKHDRWFKAQVEDKVDIRSYIVRKENGQAYRRNRRHLRATKEPFDKSDIEEAFTPEWQSQVSQRPNQEQQTQPSANTAEDSSSGSVIQPDTVRDPSEDASRGSVIQPDTVHDPSEHEIQTRSARTVKLPSHLKDFILK